MRSQASVIYVFEKQDFDSKKVAIICDFVPREVGREVRTEVDFNVWNPVVYSPKWSEALKVTEKGCRM